jgi:Arc/MetJ-type ribon-helix-helix transcriptional regulator
VGSRYNRGCSSPHHLQGVPMQLTLTPEQADFIQQELTIGHYANVTDLVADALQLLANHRRHDEWEKDVKEKVSMTSGRS